MVATGAVREVVGVRRWAPGVQHRSNHDKAACVLANKMARICYATLRDQKPFADGARFNKKLNRQAFAMPT